MLFLLSCDQMPSSMNAVGKGSLMQRAHDLRVAIAS